MYQCYTKNDKKTRNLFLQLPKRLYKGKNPQDLKTEKLILSGKHPLSKDFRVYPFVVTKEGVPVCRSLLTIYETDEVGYVGFFESEEDQEAVSYLFDQIYKKAKQEKKSSLVGPLDASIFIKYRLKLDHFENTYTGEPINLAYYPRLWEGCGFRKKEIYVSNQLRKVTDSDFDERYEKIYQRYLQRGYQFVSPTSKTFSKAMKEVYQLLIRLYASFPGYKRIDETKFLAMFGYLKQIVNYEMVRLVYKENQLYAFCICIPNYGELTVGKMTIFKIIQLLKKKKNPSEYIVMYVGASKATPGLGCALIQDLRHILYRNQCTTIGALIQEGKLTGKMYKELYVDQRTYALYEKKIENSIKERVKRGGQRDIFKGGRMVDIKN